MWLSIAESGYTCTLLVGISWSGDRKNENKNLKTQVPLAGLPLTCCMPVIKSFYPFVLQLLSVRSAWLYQESFLREVWGESNEIMDVEMLCNLWECSTDPKHHCHYFNNYP